MHEFDTSYKDAKILVVDDLSGIRTILKTTLNNLGYPNVTEARNGTDALEKLREESFQLIISDWSMPTMTGIELLTQLQRYTNLKKVPFLMMTAHSEKESVLQAISAGVVHYVIKPFSAETLQAKLEGILRKRWNAEQNQSS